MNVRYWAEHILSASLVERDRLIRGLFLQKKQISRSKCSEKKWAGEERERQVIVEAPCSDLEDLKQSESGGVGVGGIIEREESPTPFIQSLFGASAPPSPHLPS